jgi:DNA-binding transcriptional regulator YhcF (GntR family)
MAALGLQVDRDGDIPVGTQLTWQIQALITEGRLLPGEQLPSVRRLADAAGVNVNTIRSVYDRLEGEGFIRTEHGRGSFVAENRSRRWRQRWFRPAPRRVSRAAPKARGC